MAASFCRGWGRGMEEHGAGRTVASGRPLQHTLITPLTTAAFTATGKTAHAGRAEKATPTHTPFESRTEDTVGRAPRLLLKHFKVLAKSLFFIT